MTVKPREREGGRGRGGEGIEPKRAPCTKFKSWPKVWPKLGPAKTGRDSELDPCLAWVQREQKAATKGARFGAHFTQMYGFSVCSETFSLPSTPHISNHGIQVHG